MRERLGEKGTRAYSALLCLLFLPAAPYLLPGGGYLRITGFKFALYLCLTLPWLLLASPAALGRLKRGRLHPLHWAVTGFLLWSLLSALLSPWPVTALLGGDRHEGFVTLLFYGLGCLCCSALYKPGKHPCLCPAIALGFLDLLCLMQLGGMDPLGLYPPGMGWRDANILYPGSYLGSVGNAGATGAVLCTISALLFLALLRGGGPRWLLLIPLLPAAWVLGRMEVAAAALALATILLLSLLAAVRSFQALGRWLIAAPLMLTALLPCLLPVLVLSLPGLITQFLSRKQEVERPAPLLRKLIAAVTLTGLALLPLFLRAYSGDLIPLREAGAILRGEIRDAFGSGRIYIWRQVLAAVPASPLLGSGPDTLGLLELHPYVWYSAETGKTVVSSIDAAHCEYLHTLVCQGIPAAIFHVFLALLSLLRFLRRGNRASGVCAGAALCYAIQACFGISTCAAAPLFWLLLGCSEALADEEQEVIANAETLC